MNNPDEGWTDPVVPCRGADPTEEVPLGELMLEYVRAVSQQVNDRILRAAGDAAPDPAP